LLRRDIAVFAGETTSNECAFSAMVGAGNAEVYDLGAVDPPARLADVLWRQMSVEDLGFMSRCQAARQPDTQPAYLLGWHRPLAQYV
jgi:hypothetical protein